MHFSFLDGRCHPLLAEWFRAGYGEPTDVQLRAWEAIAAGRNTLIAAPTGSGKTLAALLPCLNEIIEAKLPSETNGRGDTSAKTRVLYITPLKALNNDIYDHLEQYVEQIDRLASQTNREWPGIRCAVRTGDTTSAKRASMLRRPPDVLVTTPESLYILLTSEKGRAMLRTLETVIVDEIHDLAADKRGSHLSLSLERLERLCGRRLRRIGVSATQKPLSRVAEFLGGWEEPEKEAARAEGRLSGMDEEAGETDFVWRFSDPESGEGERRFVHPFGYVPRDVCIIESRMDKRMDVRVTMPDQAKLMQSRESVWEPILDRLFQLIDGCRSVLLFVNSRRLCERLCLRLNDRAGSEIARAHHGSMAKEIRLEVERMLKAGELRCIVATSSLELGIDVGHVDLVIQLDSPLEAASGIQRVGRAGHGVGEASRGVIVARARGALPEIAVLSKQISDRDIEPIHIPINRLDVLSQQIVSIVASGGLTVDELHRLIAGSYSYKGFPRGKLEGMLQVLAGFYPFARPLLDWDRPAGMVMPRSNTAIAALTGAGTIPSSSSYPVHHAESRAHLGELDEEFVQESRVGDVFLLGTNSWMIRRIDKDRIYVSEAENRFSEVPFWRNEGPGRTYALGLKVGAFLRQLDERLSEGDPHSPGEAKASGGPDAAEESKAAEEPHAAAESITNWLADEYKLDSQAAGQLIALAESQRSSCGIPTDRHIVIEHYRDVMNQTHVIVHSLFGRKVNRTWLLAIERQFETTLPYRLYGNAKDNGIEFVLPEWDPSWLQHIWHVTPANLDRLLNEAVAGSPLLAVAFRHIAETSLLLSRGFTRTPLWQKRLRSEELLRDALPYADRFPFLQEVIEECLRDYLDIGHLRELLTAVQEGRIEVSVRESEFPSAMATQFLADYVNMRIYEGDGLDPAVQMQLMNLNQGTAKQLFGAASMRSAVPEEVLEEEGRWLGQPGFPVRGASDVWKLLKERGDLNADEIIRLAGAEAAIWLDELAAGRKAASFDFGRAGEPSVFRWISADEEGVYRSFPGDPDSERFIIGRYAENRLSFTEAELRERYPRLTLNDAREAVDRLVKEGIVKQAPFAAGPEERIWSGRDAADRMIRLSIQAARKKAEPVHPLRWFAQIAIRQHALQGTQLKGEDGLLAVLEKLQGLFLPLSHWETIIFPSRMTDYRKEDLDLLCSTGEVIWIGRKSPADKEGKVAFFLAASRPLYEPFIRSAQEREPSYPELLHRLRSGGASFLTKLSRETGRVPTEVLEQLLELAWEGHVSNDQFAPLRLSAMKKGKDWSRTGSGQGRWYWTGTLAGPEADGDEDTADAKTGSFGTAGGEQAETRGKESSELHWVKRMLDTYGIVTKELSEQWTPYSWDRLLPVLRKLEEWGTVTRGLFIEGTMNMQFTTLEHMKAVRDAWPQTVHDRPTLLSAVDPANPYGLLADWPEKEKCAYARKPGNYLVVKGERLLYWIENNGRRIYDFYGSGDSNDESDRYAELKSILGSVLKRQRLSKIVIEKWNGQDAATTAAGERLKEIGAETDRKTLVLWPSALS
ncbi:DEAD/DEAH box helicase [Paenibacillus thailandensis]|uniref:DEAD/DEAH box helicase n=1 Tax=Paenibacillus thailandensis TaxID=393250 RepID=A0ABW5QUB4_9BACL